MRLSFDVIDRLCLNSTTDSQTVLTEVIVTLQNAGADNFPRSPITTLMAALALLMLLPAFIAMLVAVA